MKFLDSFKKTTRAYIDFKEAEFSKLIIEDLIKKFNVLNSSYTGKENDTIFNEGQRNVVLYIMSKIQFTQEHLDNVIKE